MQLPVAANAGNSSAPLHRDSPGRNVFNDRLPQQIGHLQRISRPPSQRRLPANDALWPLQRVGSPVLLVEGGLRRCQDHQALLDRIYHASSHLRGGVPVEGRDGAGLMPARASAGLVAHELVDDPSGDAGVFQPGREGVAEVVGTVQVDRLQQEMPVAGQQHPPLRLGTGGKQSPHTTTTTPVRHLRPVE